MQFRIVVAQTPELTVLTEGSVRLRPVVNGGAFLGEGFPVFDAGHGFVLTGTSLYDLANRAYALRMNAKIQQMAIALRGQIAHLDDPPPPPAPTAQPPGQTRPAPTFPDGEAAGEGRGWVYWRQNVSLD